MQVATNTKRILEKIQALEKERAKLLPLRKEEIWNVLEASGGLTLDNRLLAGLAMYASNPANSDSALLRELKELGTKKIPSSRNRKAAKNQNQSNIVQQCTT